MEEKEKEKEKKETQEEHSAFCPICLRMTKHIGDECQRHDPNKEHWVI